MFVTIFPFFSSSRSDCSYSLQTKHETRNITKYNLPCAATPSAVQAGPLHTTPPQESLLLALPRTPSAIQTGRGSLRTQTRSSPHAATPCVTQASFCPSATPTAKSSSAQLPHPRPSGRPWCRSRSPSSSRAATPSAAKYPREISMFVTLLLLHDYTT